MNIRKTFSKPFIFTLLVFSIVSASVSYAFSQCGNYFRHSFAGIKKLPPTINDNMPFDEWTGDSRAEFWMARRNSATAAYDFVIYPSQPNGYWDWLNPIVLTTPVAVFQYSQFREVKDFDGDGKMDFVVQNGSGYSIYRNNGNSTLSLYSEISDPDLTTPNRVAFVDLNNDNRLDWLYTYYNSATTRQLKYKLQNQNGTFAAPQTIFTSTPENGFYISAVNVGDFNGDDLTDIVYNANINNVSNYAVIKNLGGGNFQVSPPTAAAISVYTVRDMNNDGRDDVVYGSATNLIIFYGQTDGTLNRIEYPVAPGTPAEMNGDGLLDLISISSNTYSVILNNGASGFTSTTYPKNFGGTSSQWRVEDYSGDGKADLLELGSFPKVTNTFGEEVYLVRENICHPLGQTKFANFDNNLIGDIVMWKPSTGDWSSKNAAWGTEADATAKTFNWGLGSHGDVPALGDFDGDDKTDYSVYRNSTGVWYIFRSSDSTWYVFQFGLPGDIAVPNDYDGGGKTDIAVFRPSESNWYIWSSETQQFQGINFGLNGDKPVPGDYDGDGKTDVAVFRPSEGKWYYWRSSDYSLGAINWGISTDIPVPADFDGDSRTDLAVVRDRTWYILRSLDYTPAFYTWGFSGDLPFVSFRNGLTAEMTHYRPSTGKWYYQSIFNENGLTVGGSQDTPVRFGLPNN